MRFATGLVLLTLMLGATPASPCFMTADEFTTYLKESESDLADYVNGTVMGFTKGVFDVYQETGRICPTQLNGADAVALVRRHFKAVMDKHDLLPSLACAEDVIMKIFMERFPCPPPEENPT